MGVLDSTMCCTCNKRFSQKRALLFRVSSFLAVHRERETEREREIGDIRTLNQEAFFGVFLSDWVDPLKHTLQAHGPLVKTSFKTPSLICRS
jgi:hypothetical protein